MPIGQLFRSCETIFALGFFSEFWGGVDAGEIAEKFCPRLGCYIYAGNFDYFFGGGGIWNYW